MTGNVFPFWAGNIETLAMFAIMAAAITHVAMWRFPSPRLHFWMNYGALALGGLSLVSTAYQSRATLSDWSYELLTPKLEYQRRAITEALDSAIHLSCDLKYEKGPMSPPNFDELVAEQRKECDTGRKLKAESGGWINSGDAPITIPKWVKKDARDSWNRDNFDWIEQMVAAYNQTAKERRALAQQKKISYAEINNAMVGPYAAVLAFALASAAMIFPVDGAKRRRRLKRIQRRQ